MNIEGVIDLSSAFSVSVTMDRLEARLREKRIRIFIRINQAAEAQAVGLTMPRTELLVFGDPKVGTPLMVRHPSLALDLPLKALAWEAIDGKVWLSYTAPEYLQTRHGLDFVPFKAVEGILQSAALP